MLRRILTLLSLILSAALAYTAWWYAKPLLEYYYPWHAGWITYAMESVFVLLVFLFCYIILSSIHNWVFTGKKRISILSLLLMALAIPSLYYLDIDAKKIQISNNNAYLTETKPVAPSQDNFDIVAAEGLTIGNIPAGVTEDTLLSGLIKLDPNNSESGYKYFSSEVLHSAIHTDYIGSFEDSAKVYDYFLKKVINKKEAGKTFIRYADMKATHDNFLAKNHEIEVYYQELYKNPRISEQRKSLYEDAVQYGVMKNPELLKKLNTNPDHAQKNLADAKYVFNKIKKYAEKAQVAEARCVVEYYQSVLDNKALPSRCENSPYRFALVKRIPMIDPQAQSIEHLMRSNWYYGLSAKNKKLAVQRYYQQFVYPYSYQADEQKAQEQFFEMYLDGAA